VVAWWPVAVPLSHWFHLCVVLVPSGPRAEVSSGARLLKLPLVNPQAYMQTCYRLAPEYCQILESSMTPVEECMLRYGRQASLGPEAMAAVPVKKTAGVPRLLAGAQDRLRPRWTNLLVEQHLWDHLVMEPSRSQ